MILSLRVPAIRAVAIVGACIIAVLALTTCGDQQTQAPVQQERMQTIKVGWFPAFAHNAGFLAAQVKGIYEAEGLRVEMVPLFGHDERMAALRAGRVDFVITHVPNAILDRQQHPDINIVAVLEQESPLGTYSRASERIEQPSDYPGHTIASNPGSLEFKLLPVLARLNGYDPDEVSIKELDFSALLPALLTGRVDMITGFWASGAYTWEKAARNAGKPLRFVRWSDHGWDAYGDAIVTTEAKTRDNPDQVRRFLSASLRGFHELMMHSDDVVRVVSVYSKTEQPDEVAADWERTAKALVSYGTEQHGLGWMDSEKMQAQARLVFEAYGITGGRPVEEAYSNDYLPGDSLR